MSLAFCLAELLLTSDHCRRQGWRCLSWPFRLAEQRKEFKLKTTHAITLSVLVLSLSACSKGPDRVADAGYPATSDLGTSKPAGPYSVVLMSPPGNIQPGDVPFMAHVTKDGKEVSDAKVRLDLTMPAMKMDGPHAELRHTTGNSYEGTATVMASPYAAKVAVSGPGGAGTAEFDFTVK